MFTINVLIHVFVLAVYMYLSTCTLYNVNVYECTSIHNVILHVHVQCTCTVSC